MAEVMRKEARHTQRRDRASGVPLEILEHLPPKTRVCLLYCFVLSPLTLRGLSSTTISLSLKRVNLQLQLISSWALGVFKSKPLRQLSYSPDKFTRIPTATHMIVYSLPASRGTGSLRYSNNLEPLRELETVRIKLVKDFIDEPMLAAVSTSPVLYP